MKTKHLPFYLLSCKQLFTYSLLFTAFTLISQSSHAQWNSVGFEASRPATIVKADNGNIIVATYEPDGDAPLFYSNDKGETWLEADVEPANYRGNIEIGKYLFFAGSKQRIVRTEDGGETWREFDFSHLVNGAESLEIFSLAYHNEKLYAAVFGAGIAYSEDLGETWNMTDVASLNLSPEIMGVFTYTLASFNGKLLAMGAQGVWTLNENDNSWTRTRDVYWVTNSLIHKNMLFLVYDNETYLEYTLDGVNWIKIEEGLPSFNLRAFTSDGSNLYAGTFENGVFYSENDGQRWIDITDNWPIAFEIPDVVLFHEICMSLCVVDDELFGAAFKATDGILKMKNPAPNAVSTIYESKIKTRAYPNPSNDFVNLEYITDTEDEVRITVYDVCGREIYNSYDNLQSAQSGIHTIDVKAFNNGIYVYRVKAGKDITTSRFIVNKK